jgi:hypothetical protein
VENESGQNINALDVRTRMLLDETQRELGQLKSAEVNEREKLEMRISTTLDKLMQQRDIRHVSITYKDLARLYSH